jgi:hypothetical protein
MTAYIFDSPQPILDALDAVMPSQRSAHVTEWELDQRLKAQNAAIDQMNAEIKAAGSVLAWLEARR